MTIHSPQKKTQQKDAYSQTSQPQNSPPTKIPKKTLLRQLGNLLTGDRTPHTPVTETRHQPTTIETSVVLPFSPPPVFIDYAAEGDEPADLALIELIPTGLKALNLPYIPTPQEDKKTEPSAEKTFCQLTDHLTSKEAMNQAVVAADLNELTPIELTSLNIAPKQSLNQKSLQKSLSTDTEDISETTWENALEQNETYQDTDYQGTDYQVASQSEAHRHPQSGRSPLPDLSTLRKTSPEQNPQSSLETVRIPTDYLQQLEQIVEGLLQQQRQQARHNEQLGSLVKQLLSRVAQQQTELTRLGQGTYDDVQQMIQTCLTSH